MTQICTETTPCWWPHPRASAGVLGWDWSEGSPETDLCFSVSGVADGLHPLWQHQPPTVVLILSIMWARNCNLWLFITFLYLQKILSKFIFSHWEILVVFWLCNWDMTCSGINMNGFLWGNTLYGSRLISLWLWHAWCLFRIVEIRVKTQTSTLIFRLQ